VLIPPTYILQDLKIFKFVQPQPIQIQLNLNTNTERMNSLNDIAIIISNYRLLEALAEIKYL